MTEVAQEESTTSAKSVAVEVETEVPARIKAVEGVVEKAATRAAAQAKQVLKTVAPEVKTAVDNTVVALDESEHVIVLKMENEFLKVSAQMQQLQKQAENIQRQFPEYIKSLAAKHGVDFTTHTFDAIAGVFKKTQ